MAIDWATLMSMLGQSGAAQQGMAASGAGAGQFPGGFQPGLGQASMGMTPPMAGTTPSGVVPPGFGLGQGLPAPGAAAQMPGAGQFPGGFQPGLDQASAGMTYPGAQQGTFASMLGGLGGAFAPGAEGRMSPMAQAALRLGPAMMQAGQEPRQQSPGILPVAMAGGGMGTQGRGLGRGYMAQGGGIAPRQIVRGRMP